MNVAEEADRRRYDSAADGESLIGQPAFSPSTSPPTSGAGVSFSADQLTALRKAYLPTSGGQISGANLLQRQNKNNSSPVPVVTSASNNNNHSRRSTNSDSSPLALPSSLAAMVSALSAVQPSQAMPQPPTVTSNEDALPLLQQQLLESFMQQQQQQQSLQANDTAGLLAALSGAGLAARQRPTAAAAGGNFMEIVMAALINSNSNGANSISDTSSAPTSDVLLSLLTGLNGSESTARGQPDFNALLAAAAQPQPSFDLANRLANLNNNDSKLLPSSPPAAGANGTDLLGLLGASPDLLGTLAGALNGNGSSAQPPARPPANTLFGADFGSLLNNATASGGAADPNATLAQFFATNGSANNGTGNGTTTGGFGFANGFNKSLDAYCEICDKTYCNRYFLKTHKQKKHGIYTDDNGGTVASPTKSTPTSAGFFPTAGTSHPHYERAGDKRTLRPDLSLSENGGGASKLPKLSTVSTTTFSSASAPPHSGESVDRKTGVDVFDFAEHFQRQSLGHDESALASAAAALFDPSGGSSSCGASSADAYGCDMCAAECESNVALLQHKFTAHAAALLPATGGTAGGGSHGVSDEISPPQSSSSSIAASDQPQQPKQSHHHSNSTSNNNEIGGGLLSALSQQLPALISPSILAQLTAAGANGNEFDAASLLVAISKLVGLGALGKEANGLLGSPVNSTRVFGNSSSTKQTTPKRQYTLTSKNYCDVCKKDVCNKYFLRTHMLKMHQIVIDENKPIIAKIDTNEKERAGSIMFRCDICLKENRTRMELKQHKTDVHGIAVQPPRDAAGTPLGPAKRMPKLGGMPSVPPRLVGCASVGSTSPSTIPHVYEPSGSNGCSQSVQINQIPSSGYYEAGSPAGSSSAEKGITNFLAVKEESDDNGSVASEPNNHMNNNNNNDILKIETSASTNFTANAEQLEQMLSSIAAAAAAAGGVQPKSEPSDGGGSAGVSSPSTSSSVTFDVTGVTTAPAAVSMAPSTTGAVKSESFDRDEDVADNLAGSYGVDVDMFGQLDSYKNLISQLVAASTASNNNNNNNNDVGYGDIGYGNGGDSGALRSPLLSSLENGELLRQVAMRMQQENQQHCRP